MEENFDGMHEHLDDVMDIVRLVLHRVEQVSDDVKFLKHTLNAQDISTRLDQHDSDIRTLNDAVFGESKVADAA